MTTRKKEAVKKDTFEKSWDELTIVDNFIFLSTYPKIRKVNMTYQKEIFGPSSFISRTQPQPP